MRLWQISVLAGLVGLVGQAGTGAGQLTQAEKNALLSRKKWYVTFDFSLSGQGAQGGSSWKISSQSGGTIELNHVTPGQFPPLSTAAGDVQDVLTPGRYIGWMAVPTDETYRRVEQGEQNPARLEGLWYPYERQVNNSSRSADREDTWQGAGTGYAVGPCQFVLDLKKGTYDLVFQVGGSDIGSKVRHVWRSRDSSGQEDSPPTHHYAWMANDWIPQLAGRNLRADMKPDGSFSFSFQGPVRLSTGPSGRDNVQFRGTFKISPSPPSVAKLIIEPKAPAIYQKWRPQPGPLEDRPGSGLEFKYTVDEPGVPPDKRSKLVRLTWRLGGVSRYPGVCMNWPMAPSGPPKPDLQFKPIADTAALEYTMGAENESVNIVSKTDQEVPRTGTVEVECFDGGAIGEILAEAELSDGRVLECEVRGNSVSRKILIPDRKEGQSDIANHWRDTRGGGLPDNDDSENDPVGDGQPGDGLTLWEEYRGFRQGGLWRDNCDPKKKDLFVVNKIGGAIARGLTLFEEATGLVLHRHLKEKEYLLDRRINHHMRSDLHVVDQHCILLEPSPFSWKGNCESALGKPMGGPPKNTWKVNVLMGLNQGRLFTTSQPGVPTIQDAQAVMVAHELSHGIGVYHHGESDVLANWMLRNDGSIWENGTKQITVLGEPLAQQIPALDVFGPNNNKLEGLTIGMPQGQHSGDAYCYMRYDTASAYPHMALPSLNRIFHNMFEAPGNRLCTSADGTEVNDSSHRPHSRYFSADSQNSRGDCRHQFVISDKWEAKAR